MSDHTVILVHGFNKSKSDMRFMEETLQTAGFTTYSADLPTTFGSMDECVASLRLQTKVLIEQAENISYIAHSMGGLITRKYIDKFKPPNIVACVFIATPHFGSQLARVADYVPGYSAIFKPIKSLLPGKNYIEFPETRSFRVGVIAGNSNEGLLGKLMLSAESDGRVEVSSTVADDVNDFITVPYGHKRIHHHPHTGALVIRFLKEGEFLET